MNETKGGYRSVGVTVLSENFLAGWTGTDRAPDADNFEAMLDLAPRNRALDVFHRHFQDETLPEALKSGTFATFARATYDVHEIRWGRSAWQARVLDEYRSQIAFTDLLNDLTQLGCSFDVLGTAIRVVRDEARHVEICRRMTAASVAPAPGKPAPGRAKCAARTHRPGPDSFDSAPWPRPSG